MFKKALLLGISAAVLSSTGAVAYAAFYNANLNDYTYLLGYVSITAACVFVCIFACVMFWVAEMIFPKYGEFIFNLLFAFGSMTSIYYPLNSTFENDSFGYFMVYAMPLHFFPVLSWFVLKSLIYRANS